MLWFYWSLRLTLSTLLSTSFISLGITLFLYFFQGFQELNSDVYRALFEIFQFWFPLVWSLMLLLFLFRTLKYIFNSCYNGYKLTLLSCPKEAKSETIEVIGYGDLLKVWRKWLMLLIWLVAGLMVVAVVFTQFFTAYESVFDWFSIYILYLFILLSAYLSFIILSSRCKRVRIVKC